MNSRAALSAALSAGPSTTSAAARPGAARALTRRRGLMSTGFSLTGFTLIELLVVLGIVALMLTLAVPRYFPSIDKSREVVLADNLRNLRSVIDQYYGDTGRYPDTLDQLVEKKYLRALPVDPLTESETSWIVVPPEDGSKGGVYNVKSGAPGNDRSGKPYGDW